MNDQSKTKQMLIQELVSLRDRISELERSESGHKRLTEMLKKTGQELKLIFDASPSLIWQKDLEGRYLQVNKAYCNTVGLSKDTILGKTDYDLFSKEIADQYVNRDRKVLDTGISEFGIEEYHQKSSGEYGWSRTDKLIYYDFNGKIKGTIGFATDITERKQAEEALRKSEELYRILSENSPSMIFLLDVEGNVLVVNQQSAAKFGLKPDEIIGRNIRDLFPKQLAERHKQALDKLLQDGKNLHIELIESFPTGERWIEARLVPVWNKENSKIIAVLGISHDITEHKQAEEILLESEEQYRTVVENASDIVFRLDNTGHITFVNPAALRIMGYEEKEFIGRHYPTFIRSDMQEEAMNFFGRQFVKEIPNTYSEYPVIVKDGREIWLGQNTQLIFRDGKVVAFQAVARDITERKSMEEKIIALSVTDQLTGLYNRRGFLFHAEQQLKLSERNKSKLLLFFADLDLLKWINDELGHEEGDKALIESANILKETFRTSDIIARLGGDEFAILAIDIDGVNPEVFTSRLQKLIDIWNNQENRKYKLSISIGCAYYDPEKPCSIDDLISRADKMMYEQKQNKKGLLL